MDSNKLDKDSSKSPQLADNSGSYHHGNVKQALVDAAMKLVESERIEEISLRGLARDIGITPSAVYNHFADKNQLLVAIRLRAFSIFNEYFEGIGLNNQQVQPDSVLKAPEPEQVLLKLACTYCQFSRLYPSLYRFLFHFSLPIEVWNEESATISTRGIAICRDLVIKIYQHHNLKFNEQMATYAALLIWSQLHGMVGLINSGSINAAVMSQGWPEACALNNASEVERLIKTQINSIIDNAVANQDSL